MAKEKELPKITIGEITYEYEVICWEIDIESKINLIGLFDLPFYDDEVYNVFTDHKGWIQVMIRNNQFYDEEDKIVPYKRILKRLQIIPAYQVTVCKTKLYKTFD